MKAVIIVESPHGRRVEFEEVRTPVPGRNEVLIKVRAAGMNRADLAMNPQHRETGPRASAPIAGLEFGGEVVEVGADVTTLKPGDRVMGFGTAAFAEYTVIDRRLAIPLTWNIAWEDAAALPVAIETMHDALITNGRLRRGQSVLIQGAASGVGIVGLQIAKARGASIVFGASRSSSKLDDLYRFGMDQGINTSQADWHNEILQKTGGRGVDLTVDMVAAGVANSNLAATAIGGRIVNVGRLGGFTGDFDFDLHAKRRISYVGVTFRTRNNDEIAELIQLMLTDLLPELVAGQIAMPISRIFNLADAGAAYEYMKTNEHVGKIILRV